MISKIIKKKALESQISCEFNLIVKPETTTAKKKNNIIINWVKI